MMCQLTITMKVTHNSVARLHPCCAALVLWTRCAPNHVHASNALKQAVKYYRLALRIQTECLGPHHKDTIATMAGLGVALRNQGNLAEALLPLEQVNAACSEQFGPNDQRTATSFVELSTAYRHLGKVDKATDCCRKAVEIHESLMKLHPDDSHVAKAAATAYVSLGRSLNDSHYFEEAIEAFDKALVLRRKWWGERHPEVASVYNNLGVSHRQRENFSLALENHAKSLAIRTEQLGVTHPTTAGVLHNIATCHLSKLDLDEAISHYQQAFDIRREALGADHYSVAYSMSGLGHAFAIQGRYDKAKSLLQLALKRQCKALGEVHIETAQTEWYLGEMYRMSGKAYLASSFLTSALEHQLSLLRESHPDIAKSRVSLAKVLFGTGQLPKAANVLHTAFKALQRERTVPQLLLADMHILLAQIEGESQQLEEAQSILLRFYPPEHDKVQEVSTLIATLTAKDQT